MVESKYVVPYLNPRFSPFALTNASKSMFKICFLHYEFKPETFEYQVVYECGCCVTFAEEVFGDKPPVKFVRNDKDGAIGSVRAYCPMCGSELTIL